LFGDEAELELFVVFATEAKLPLVCFASFSGAVVLASDFSNFLIFFAVAILNTPKG
jgi:hypothetical protein